MNELWLAEAALGRDSEDFLRSDLGKFIVGRCDAEIAEAQEALATVSPWRRNRIRQLQNDIYRAKSLKGWLVELVLAGRQAEAQLDGEHDE